MRRTLFLLLAIAVAPPLLAQVGRTEYGKPDELKGLTKVFIDTAGDLKNRERIAKEIEKAKLGLTLLDSAEGAEIVIDFRGGKEREFGGVHARPDGNGGAVATARTNVVTVGAGAVYVARADRLRVVMSFEDREETVFEKKPATNFGRDFVKAYKKANGIK
jgi:hypothetical protein